MIILSNTLALTETPGLDLDAPIIGYRNAITDPVQLVAESEDPEHPVAHLANPSTAQRWLSEATDEQYVTGTINEVGTFDYLAIARHNLGSAEIPISIERATGELDSSADPEYEEIVQEVVLPNDSPALFRFEEQPLSGFRLRLQQGNAPPTIAVLYVGKLLVHQRRLYVGHSPINLSRRVNSETGQSESGQFLGSIVTGSHVETSVDLPNVTPDFYRTHVDPFVEAALGVTTTGSNRTNKPFFFGWRPLSYPNEIGFCWFPDGFVPRPVNQRPNGMMSVSLELTGIA